MFRVTLIGLPIPTLTKARLTVTTDDGSGLILDVISGGFAVGQLNLRGATSDVTAALQLNDGSPSVAKALHLPSNTSLHIQIVDTMQSPGSLQGIGHIVHPGMRGQNPIELECDGNPPRKQSCPGSLVCGDLTLTC